MTAVIFEKNYKTDHVVIIFLFQKKVSFFLKKIICDHQNGSRIFLLNFLIKILHKKPVYLTCDDDGVISYLIIMFSFFY